MTPEERLRELLPRLRASPFRITSAATGDYNCIGWALRDDRRWWSPVDADWAYWPAGLARRGLGADIPVADVARALALEGFAECESAELERDMEKLAIYGDEHGFTHVARQLENGRWTSKLGEQWDIEHELEAVAGRESAWPAYRYGSVVAFMSRPRAGVE